MRFVRKHLVTIVLTLVFLVGVCLLAYPSVSDWWNSMHASRAVTTYTKAVEEVTPEDYEAILNDARAYNASLAENPTSFELSDEEMAVYSQKLAVEGTDVIASVKIDRLGVELPIYHGTSDDSLQQGIGHFAGSSLPVGGESTHVVLVGHRGLPSAKLFTDLNLLEVGDTFSVTALGQTTWYEVDQILIVEPTELGALAIEEGEELCTLVTCTPYGVNTHRLLVRGHGVDGPSEGAYLAADAVQIDPVLVACVVAVPLLGVRAVGVLLAGRLRRRQR